MSAPSGGGREGGMVLVEVLTALAIVAVMSGLMLAFLGQLRAVGAAQAALSARAELAAAAGHLQRTLAAAKPAPVAGEDAVFDGKPAEMRFAAVARRGFRSLALRDVRVSAEAVGGRPALVERLAARRTEAGAADRAPAEFVILDGLTGARFEYADDGGAFSDSWHGDQLPAAVRITLSREVRGRSVSVQAVARTR
jgi:hypothetical protein